jgi:hypothetical protein
MLHPGQVLLRVRVGISRRGGCGGRRLAGAGDIEAAAGLVTGLGVGVYRQGRVSTVERWLGWLDGQEGIEGHPMASVLASLLAALTARPVDAERWADVVDRWQYGDAARPDDPAAEAWAALLRAILCRRGAGQMRADAAEVMRGSRQ